MGININSLEILTQRVSRYSEFYGAKTILEAKTLPKTDVKLSSLKLDNLSIDCLHLKKSTKAKFTPLEQELMESVRGLKHEHAYNIKKDGKLDTSIKLINNKSSAKLAPGQSMDEINKILEDATVIHNHPEKVSLSCGDFQTMAKKKFKKIISTTTDGGYSLLERKCNWNEEKHFNFIFECNKLVNEEFAKVSELKGTRGIRNTDRINKLNEWRSQRFGQVADDFGLTYINNITKTKVFDGSKKNAFGVNPLRNFVDNIIYYKNSLFGKS